MRFRDYFSKNFETRDNNFYESLRTHYYRTRYDNAIETIHELVETFGATIIDENEKFKEVLFESSEYSCTTIITEITPVEIAIDFKITTFNLIGMGKGKKAIEKFYSFLDKKLSFKGIGLYKG